MTLGKMALSIKDLHVTFSIGTLSLNDIITMLCYYTECSVVFISIQNVVMLRAILLIAVVPLAKLVTFKKIYLSFTFHLNISRGSNI